MEKVGNAYKEWIRYLIKKKWYGTWMRDLAILTNYLNVNGSDYQYGACYYRSGVNYNTLMLPKCTIKHFLPLVYYIIQCESKLDMKCWLNQVSNIKKFHIYGFGYLSTVNWRHEYDEFEKLNTSNALSKKLSRKIYRTNNKVSSGRIKEKQIQPWYSKSYEKYNKNLWRK